MIYSLCSKHGLHPQTRCPRCKTEDNQRRNAKAKRHGLKTATWGEFRLRRLSISPHCELGLPGCSGRSTTVHLDPELEGDHSRATTLNTKACCAGCHGVVDGQRARA